MDLLKKYWALLVLSALALIIVTVGVTALIIRPPAVANTQASPTIKDPNRVISQDDIDKALAGDGSLRPGDKTYSNDEARPIEYADLVQGGAGILGPAPETDNPDQFARWVVACLSYTPEVIEAGKAGKVVQAWENVWTPPAKTLMTDDVRLAPEMKKIFFKYWQLRPEDWAGMPSTGAAITNIFSSEPLPYEGRMIFSKKYSPHQEIFLNPLDRGMLAWVVRAETVKYDADDGLNEVINHENIILMTCDPTCTLDGWIKTQ